MRLKKIWKGAKWFKRGKRRSWLARASKRRRVICSKEMWIGATFQATSSAWATKASQTNSFAMSDGSADTQSRQRKSKSWRVQRKKPKKSKSFRRNSSESKKKSKGKKCYRIAAKVTCQHPRGSLLNSWRETIRRWSSSISRKYRTYELIEANEIPKIVIKFAHPKWHLLVPIKSLYFENLIITLISFPHSIPIIIINIYN